MAEELAMSLRLARSQPSAFGAVYRRQAPLLFKFFARRTFDIDVASDLTAETFAQAFEHRRRFRGSTDGEARGWLFAIAQHQLSRYVRRGIVEYSAVKRLGIQVPTLAPDDHERMIELAGLAEARERVRAAFGGLPAEQHEALRLRVIDECPYAEVAATLGVSEQTARARVSRALHRLAKAADMTTPSEVRP
jgi:RNA polymerase sigma factor (sigma-70 family)